MKEVTTGQKEQRERRASADRMPVAQDHKDKGSRRRSPVFDDAKARNLKKIPDSPYKK
jgi:hypothetical protein